MQLADASLFNIIISVLMILFGFLLNRVFSEIDKLSSSQSKLKEAVLKEYVSDDEFIRHIETDGRLLDKMSNEINKRFDKLDILLEAVRVKQLDDRTHKRESD